MAEVRVPEMVGVVEQRRQPPEAERVQEPEQAEGQGIRASTKKLT